MAIRLHGTFDRPAGPLFDLYERYVGEPRSRKDVYGYWAFILGYVLGLLGVTAYLIGTSPGRPDFLLREVTIAISAVGLAMAMFGVGLLLPVRRRGIEASIGGLIVALGSVAAFISIYPEQWAAATDASGIVITAYTAGVAVVAGVAALVPVLTGEKGWLVSDMEESRDHPPVMVGETAHGALFTVYQVGTGEWTWRVIRQDALGENAADPYSRPDVEAAVEGLRTTLGEARLLEITTAAFRLYETTDEEWRWTLMRDDGSVVATSGTAYDGRNAAVNATSLLKERGPSAPVIDVRGGAFECYELDGRWGWRLLDEGRQSLAESANKYPDRNEAESAIDNVAARIGEVPVLTLDAIGVELFEVDDEWRWRIVDEADDVVATGVDGYDSRRSVESAASGLLPALGEATIIDADTPGYELFEGDDGWYFRLVDEEDEVVAHGHEPLASAEVAGDRSDWMAATIEDADIIQYEGGSFEVYPVDEQWQWRLVTEDRELIAASTSSYDDPGVAAEAVEGVTERARDADLIEFENAAFQQYETDGRWRWRLIDEDGGVMADSGADYASRAEAGDAMTTLKQHAPTAEILEIETAAFELFRDDDAWGWRLIDEGGRMVAQGAARHPSRAAAKEAMDYLVAHSESPTTRTMDRAAFQFYTDTDDEWRWRYLHPDGAIVADGERSYTTRDQLVEAVADLREIAALADIHTIDDLGVVLFERGAGWRFRFVARDRQVVAESSSSYDSKPAVRSAVEVIRAQLPGATVFAIGDGLIRITGQDESYQWELLDAERTVLATSPTIYPDPDTATSVAERARSLAPEASLIDYESAAFQIYRDGGAWGWRLIDEDGVTVAAGAAEHTSQEQANDAIESVRALLESASVLEIDDATFELHRRSDGWTWRLVDENGTPLVKSVEAHPSRGEARAAMDSVKDYAPEGWISVVE